MALLRPLRILAERHFLLAAAVPVYSLSAVSLMVYMVKRIARGSATFSPLLFMAILAAEFAYSLAATSRSILSPYRPFFPDFAAGPIIGCITLIVAKPFLHTTSARALLISGFFLWFFGGLVTDSLWYSEGTERGMGPLWNAPLLGALIVGFGFVVLGSAPLTMLADDAYNFQFVGAAAWLVAIAFLGYWLWRLKPVLVRAGAVALSIALLGFKFAEWALFIMD